MLFLVLGLLLFLGIHTTAILGLREPAVARLGEGPWKGLYSLISFVGLGLIVWGYGQARMDPTFLWIPPRGVKHLALALMLPVFPMLFAAYLPGRIQTRLKHPMLAGVKLWALAHLVANGTVADLLLFGGVLAWAVADRISLKRRPVVREIPMAPPTALNDVLAVGLGLLTYGLFVGGLHTWLIGVPPIP